MMNSDPLEPNTKYKQVTERKQIDCSHCQGKGYVEVISKSLINTHETTDKW